MDDGHCRGSGDGIDIPLEKVVEVCLENVAE